VELLAEGCLQFGDINLKSSMKNEYRQTGKPANGYNPNETTSRKAEKWLKFLAESEGLHIQHAKNGGEKRIGKYKVDGYCGSKKRIYEFQGVFQWEVGAMRSDSVMRGITRYEVKWVGYEATTFEQIKYLYNCHNTVQAYLREKSLLKPLTQDNLST
jgi:hypothetical protein